MTKFNKLVQEIAWSPLVWGSLAALAFYAPLHSGRWTNAFVLRYFAGHPVEHVATTLFLVGIAALIIKAIGVREQFASLQSPLLDAKSQRPESVDRCEPLLSRLGSVPAGLRHSYLVRRLRELLEFVQRKGDADTLDEQLRYLADVDVARMHGSYSLVKIIIWAIPILGLLGTVIGITAAVANLSPQSLESSVANVTAGLGVAFDHTALALGLSIALMFSQFFVERYEQRLLSEVDERAAAEMVGRFEQTLGGSDPQVAVLRRLAETMLHGVEKLVLRQTELWQQSIGAAQEQWSQLTTAAGGQLEAALGAALRKGLQEHAAALTAAEASQAEQAQRHWGQVQQALLQNAEAVTLQQRELVRQGEVLLQVVDATSQVTRLENELNRNLATLTGARHFEDTVASLSAAAHLLIARLGQLPPDAPSVSLRSAPRTGQAA